MSHKLTDKSEADKGEAPDSAFKFIAIAGNIGAGKSSLTNLLAKHFGWQEMYEPAEDNPYLADFYDDMMRWSFNLQIYFLSNRFRQQKKMLQQGGNFVQDRTIYEDVEIFARNLHDMDLMSDRDFNNYVSLFREMTYYLQPPTLLIYIRAQVPTLVKQIQQRGRDYESSIRIEYLERLNRLYETWIEQYPHEKLIIDSDHIDFVNKNEDMGKVIELIERRLFGLFK